MKAHRRWNYTPYTPLDRPKRYYNPYVCQITPYENKCYIAFIDNSKLESSTYTIFLKKCDDELYTKFTPNEFSYTFTDLASDIDYEFYIERNDGCKSEIRKFRCGPIEGCVVNYIHPNDDTYSFSGRYLCSPCLIKLPSGKLLSSMDVFEGNNSQNLTLIFESTDNGKTWKYLTELFPCFWGQFFIENNRLYMLGISDEYGDLLIGYSDDEGKNWSEPNVIFRGSSNTRERGLHRAPMKLLRAGGRLWTDIEYGAWGKKEFNNAILSAPLGEDDYSNPDVWSLSNFFMHNEFKNNNLDNEIVKNQCGAIEGNCVVDKNGQVYDFLRYTNRTCLLLKLVDNDPDGNLVFDRLVDFDITSSKFDIVYDEKSSCYYSICSRDLKDVKTVRNVLSLYKSKDFIHWDLVCDLIDKRDEDPSVVGFQYISFIIDGDNILYLSRTAYNNPHNFHDSNYQTFHTIKNFRKIGN